MLLKKLRINFVLSEIVTLIFTGIVNKIIYIKCLKQYLTCYEHSLNSTLVTSGDGRVLIAPLVSDN